MNAWYLAALLALAGCTAGASAPPAGGGTATATTIDVNLTLHQSSASPFGTLAGYAPPVTNVALGSSIRFVNSDSFSHTASSIAGNAFPAGSPFSTAAQTQSGTMLSQGWSSGTLPAGASSQTILVDAAGTYFYGCFFHYGSPMRGAVVAR
jgi:plastocyanin